MIFAAMGTSVPFPRLLKRLDEIAAELPEEILVQTGTTPQTAKFCRMFDYAPSLEPYYEQARLSWRTRNPAGAAAHEETVYHDSAAGEIS